MLNVQQSDHKTQYPHFAKPKSQAIAGFIDTDVEFSLQGEFSQILPRNSVCGVRLVQSQCVRYYSSHFRRPARQSLSIPLLRLQLPLSPSLQRHSDTEGLKASAAICAGR